MANPIPRLQLETPDLPLLDNPGYITSVIEPPEPTNIIGPPDDGIFDDAASRPGAGAAARCAVLAAALGVVVVLVL